MADADTPAVALNTSTQRSEPRRASRWLPWARRVLTLVLLVAAALAAYQHRSEIADASSKLTNVDAGWLVAAIAAEVASMVIFARLQRWLLRAGGVEVPLVSMVEITVAGNAMSTSLPGGAAWSAAWVYGQLRRRGTNRVLAGWVILVAGALASFAIFVILAVGSWVAGNHGPVASLRWVTAVLAAIPVVIALGVAAAARSSSVRGFFSRLWQALTARSKPVAAVGRLVQRLIHDLGLVRPGVAGWAEAFSLALGNWLCDAACLVACAEALGVPVPWRGVLVIYGLTQVSASLPITPGGIGVVEGSMAALLIAYGTHAAPALAVVLLYRIVSFWGLVPIGWGAWLGLELAERGGIRHRPHPWAAHQHGDEPAPVLPAKGPEHLVRPAPCRECPAVSHVTAHDEPRRTVIS